MTVADLWIAVPLLILAGGSLIVLLLGAAVPGNDGYVAAVVAVSGSALWAMQNPGLTVAPNLGLCATPLARMFVVLFCLTAAAVLVISRRYNERLGIVGEEYPATILFTTFGMASLSMAGNLLVLFMGLEAMTFGFYILVAIDVRREISAEAGLKYLLMGATAAAFLAFGIGLHYAGTGSLSLAEAAVMADGNSIARAGWAFILIGMAFKLSLVPAHLWTPDVYQGAPAPVTGFLSASSKGATVAFLLLVLPHAGIQSIKPLLWWLALLSMIVGNLAALTQANVRRMLGYSSIGQMGYVAIALLSGGTGGYRAAAFYAVAYAAMSLASFGALAIIETKGGETSVEDLAGMGRRNPLIAGVLALALFGLAGIPPTAGFTGKFLIFSAALKAGETSLAIVGILASAVSAYYYLRIMVSLYMEDRTGEEAAASFPESAVLVAVGAVILILGIVPSPLLGLIGAALP